MRPEASFSDRELDSAFLVWDESAPVARDPFSVTMRFTASEVKPLDRVCPLNGLPHKSVHMPRSRAPISMLTADCGAEVLPTSTAIGAVVRVKRGGMSSGKNRERGANV